MRKKFRKPTIFGTLVVAGGKDSNQRPTGYELLSEKSADSFHSVWDSLAREFQSLRDLCTFQSSLFIPRMGHGMGLVYEIRFLSNSIWLHNFKTIWEVSLHLFRVLLLHKLAERALRLSWIRLWLLYGLQNSMPHIHLFRSKSPYKKPQ